MAVIVERFGIRENVVDEIRKYAVYSVGAFAGFGISQFTAEFLTRYANLSGSTAMLVKILSRFGWWFVFIYLSTMMPSPALTAFMAGAGIGAFAGIFNDIFEKLYPGGFTSMASATVASLRGRTQSYVSAGKEEMIVR